MKIRVVLTLMNLDETLLRFYKMSTPQMVEEKQRKDRKILSQIYLHFLNNIFYKALNEKMTTALWLQF